MTSVRDEKGALKPLPLMQAGKRWMRHATIQERSGYLTFAPEAGFAADAGLPLEAAALDGAFFGLDAAVFAAVW